MVKKFGEKLLIYLRKDERKYPMKRLEKYFLKNYHSKNSGLHEMLPGIIKIKQ